MKLSLGFVTGAIITAAIVAALVWGYFRQRAEKRRRKQGIVTIPLGSGHLLTAGCLGVLGYLGLVFVLTSLTFDLVDEAEGPEWLAWAVAIGLLAGFFIMVGWAAFGIGSSFAMTRLVLDKETIRLIQRRRTKLVIFWDKRWGLERLAHVDRLGHEAAGGGTQYSLYYRLRQGRKELVLAFDASGNEVGGLPPYEGQQEALQVGNKGGWLQSEILFRHERWDETQAKKAAAVNADELTALAPDAALQGALNFTLDDLVENRIGKASEAQIDSIRGDQKLTLATYLVLAAVFGAGGLYSLIRLLQGGSSGAFGPWLVVLLLATGFCLFMALVTRQQLRSEILVEGISGRVQLGHYQESDEYWLRIGDEAFSVTEQVYEVLQNDGYYRFYVARYGTAGQDVKLLAVEKLGPDGGR